MVRKRTYPNGKITWGYSFNGPASTPEKRDQIRQWGFETKKAAVNAESQRRLDEQKAHEATLAGSTKPLPKTLRALFAEFFKEHAERNLAPKTLYRYRELQDYLSDELLDMRIEVITPLHLTREWNRLKDSGGHLRTTKAARPLASKTVRHIAGLVSSAFRRAKAWGLVANNPVTDSDRPRLEAGTGIALSVDQQSLMLAAASEHSALPIILELAAATGARRGEVMALRRSDIRDGQAHISRSLSQAGNQLIFKSTKTERARIVTLPESTLRAIEKHLLEQDGMRNRFGPTYRKDLDLIVCDVDGSPLKPDSISSSVSALCRRLKLPKGVSLHTLRHSHGSQLLAGGMELTAVAERLGHSSPNVTAKVYAHALKGRDAEAARVWERMQGRGTVKESLTVSEEKAN